MTLPARRPKQFISQPNAVCIDDVTLAILGDILDSAVAVILCRDISVKPRTMTNVVSAILVWRRINGQKKEADHKGKEIG